ncbi:hypothetical protein GGP41_006087 [Bipolaris sorokiniana]|uniref:AA1-like domain-containing protein n=2 Tax=Cochliobolus sativus TaxID=45130 RepID=A0A8H5ZI08_COCSA|nr:uncharacterized protein COCSADRAFT_348903 [Bipolaris sorokiniana ND90Pr]EMD58634.1 hypothetical protein COCSADRAFT_348903 [Bipolaris sorokiniana ND90Pr]KAF5849159.1 hypothetical protein GGP41_006087 [Bipolaris sorokiniana]
MHFATPLLALIAAVSAAPSIEDIGYWNVTISHEFAGRRGYTEKLHAEFRSPYYTKPLVTDCTASYTFSNGRTTPVCTPNSLAYAYNVQTEIFSMRQCITKPAKLVATGNHKVDIKVNGGKDLRPYTGNFIVPVLERYPEK